MVERLRDQLKQFRYCVQRNWETLPDLDPAHPDLDLFVHFDDLDEILEVVPDWVDVRHMGDGYYPTEIGEELLKDIREWNGWFIPSPKAHFLSLYWHNAVHKPDDPYKDKLRKVFFEWVPPMRADDQGVGFYGLN